MMPKLFIITGEASGDQHAAQLVPDLQKRYPNLKIYALAGPAIKAHGATCFADIKALNCMGLIEVLSKIPSILITWLTCLYQLKTHRPTLTLLVDSPAFNLPLLKWSKRYSQATLYYIAPKLWAHGQKRYLYLKKYVDQLAVIFPFEQDYFKQRAIPTHYVGNPTYATPLPYPDQHSARHSLHIPHPIVIGLLPGSRPSEIKRLLPILIKLAKKCQANNLKLSFLLPIAPTLNAQAIHTQLKDTPITPLLGHAKQVMQAADLVIVASGTACLETAASLTPMIVIYKVHPLTAWIARKKLHTPWVSLPNILAQKNIVPEVLQDALTPDSLYQTMLTYYPNTPAWSKQKQSLITLKAQFNTQSTSLHSLIYRYIDKY